MAEYVKINSKLNMLFAKKNHDIKMFILLLKILIRMARGIITKLPAQGECRALISPRALTILNF